MVEGVYTVSLTIRNYQGNSITEVMENLIAVYDEEQPVMGDVNGDGVVDVVDIERVIEIMLGDTPSEYELWVVDLHNDGFIDVFDIFMMVDIILGRTAVPAVRKKNTGDTISKSFHTE
jgi:PKD repeat protein